MKKKSSFGEVSSKSSRVNQVWPSFYGENRATNRTNKKTRGFFSWIRTVSWMPQQTRYCVSSLIRASATRSAQQPKKSIPSPSPPNYLFETIQETVLGKGLLIESTLRGNRFLSSAFHCIIRDTVFYVSSILFCRAHSSSWTGGRKV